MNFKEWIEKEKNKKASSADKYSGAISGRLSKMAREHEFIESSLLEVTKPLDVARKIKQLNEFKILNSTGNSMYSRALDLFVEYKYSSILQVEKDIEEILSNTSTTITEKESLIKSRIGQGQYRQSLLKIWKGCSTTGCTETELLVASHIKPWRVSNTEERLDKFNGFILLATIDKAFDIGLISFSKNGNILISPNFTDIKHTGIHNTMKIELSPEHEKYLDYHRTFIYQNT